MMAWPLAAAVESQCFEKIIVSTDDPDIANIARTHGAWVPFVRPAELADDHSTTIAVIAHAIEWLRNNGHEPVEVCCLYATAPFVAVADLQHGLQLLQSNDCDYVFTVTAYPFPIQRALRQTQNGRVEMFNPGNFNVRSQDLEPAFHDAAQFYWGRAEAWLASRPLFAAGSIPLLLPSHRVQDIDTVDDWKRAELMFNAMQAGTN